MQKMLTKAPKRIETFKSMAPNLKLPPKPVITRWGTWISNTIYFFENYEIIKTIFNSYDFKKSVCVRKIQKYLSKSSSKFELDLKYIDDHFKILKNTIKILETRNLTIDKV